jgi:DNA-binding transcriptional regulator GbsR (MarR family)
LATWSVGAIIGSSLSGQAIAIIRFFLYIRNMPNIKKISGKDERRFIEDVARLLTPWGVPPAAARLYGYLLLCPRPVSLDEITGDLGISKSSASVAARLLESYTLARRHREGGTKRALYAVADNYETMIRQQNQLLDALAGQLKAGTRIVASKEVNARLGEMAEFYLTMRGAMDDAMRRWKRDRRPR